MADMQYSKYIITDAGPETPLMYKHLEEAARRGKSSIKFTHLLSVDENRIKDFFYVDAGWLWSGSLEDAVDEAHSHAFDEVMAFVGSNRDDPHDLGGEINIWLNNEKKSLTRSCLIFLPAGTVHGPLQFKRIDRPVFSGTIALTGKYSRMTEDQASIPQSPYAIITETKARFTVAASGGNTPPPPPPNPKLKSSRILHLEDDMAKGSFYVDFVWIYEGDGGAPAPEHNHERVELIAMVGSDPQHPHDLGGAMSIVLGDEDHVLTKSNFVCIPKGLKHCPWKFIGIKKPTLVFTAGPSGMYSGSHKKD